MSASVFFHKSWMDMFKDLNDSQAGRLVKAILSYSESSVVTDVFDDDSFLSGMWCRVRSMIDLETARKKQISLARKEAGSKGGRKRAERYRKPDGHSSPVFSGVSEVSGVDDVQCSLYSNDELKDSVHAVSATVVPLPSSVSSDKSSVAPAAEAGKTVSRKPWVPSISSFVAKQGVRFIRSLADVMTSPSVAGSPVFCVPVVVGEGQMGNLFSEYGKSFDEVEAPPKKAKKSRKKAPTNFVDDPLDEVKVRRHRYGYYKRVLLTDEQYETLKVEFPDTYEDWIREVDDYCERSGRTYSNFLAVVRNWSRRRKNDANGKNQKFKKPAPKGRPVYCDNPEDLPFYDPYNQKLHDEYMAMIDAEEERIRNLGKDSPGVSA